MASAFFSLFVESIFIALVGLGLLVWSADRFITASLLLAGRLKVPPAVIGATAVAFGTSAPELTTSLSAAWVGSPGIAIGNALGSNIANIGLVIGLSALLIPIRVEPKFLRREIPLLLVATVIAGLTLADRQLSRMEGAILLLMLLPIMLPLILENDESAGAGGTGTSLLFILGRFILLTALLVLGARALVYGAEQLALAIGIDSFIIGLTLVAVGTSLPELATTLGALRRNQPGIAVGCLFGSNIFNTLGVMGAAAAVHPWQAVTAPLLRSFGMVTVFTLLLAALLYWQYWRRAAGEAIITGRAFAALLLLGYAAYVGSLFYF